MPILQGEKNILPAGFYMSQPEYPSFDLHTCDWALCTFVRELPFPKSTQHPENQVIRSTRNSCRTNSKLSASTFNNSRENPP